MLYYRSLGEYLFPCPRSLSTPRPSSLKVRKEVKHTLPPPYCPQEKGERMNSLASSLQADLGTLNIEIVAISKRIALEISISLFLSSYFLHF